MKECEGDCRNGLNALSAEVHSSKCSSLAINEVERNCTDCRSGMKRYLMLLRAPGVPGMQTPLPARSSDSVICSPAHLRMGRRVVSLGATKTSIPARRTVSRQLSRRSCQLRISVGIRGFSQTKSSMQPFIVTSEGPNPQELARLQCLRSVLHSAMTVRIAGLVVSPLSS
jgi:hypothetical protein